METTTRTDDYSLARTAATVTAAMTVWAPVSLTWYSWHAPAASLTIAAVCGLFARTETRRVRRERKLRRILRRYPGRVITTRLP